MRMGLMCGIGLASVLAAGSACAATVVEGDRFVCVQPEGEPTHSEAMMMFASTSAARTIRVVKGARVTPSAEPMAWCSDLPGLEGSGGERREDAAAAPAGKCRTDGPQIPHGPLSLTVVETMLGAPAREIEVRLRPQARAAFVPEGPGVGCNGGSLAETIANEGYFSPSLIALDPQREYLLSEAQDETGEMMIVAVALPAKSAALKASLRKALRERAREAR